MMSAGAVHTLRPWEQAASVRRGQLEEEEEEWAEQQGLPGLRVLLCAMYHTSCSNQTWRSAGD